jgi:sn-glycerol 3-phosphate transport system substrate-binding protein
MRFLTSLLAAAVLSLPLTALAARAARAPAAAAPATPTTIELSHRLDEERAERLEPLVEQFNAEQKLVHVKLVRRVEGEAPKEMNLVTPEEQANFVAHKAKFKPLYEVMREAKEPFDASHLSPELRADVSDSKGRLFALPVAFSTPVLYINKADFRKAGLDPEKPPKTWLEMQETAGKLYVAGVRCPYTTSWPVWMFMDNVSAWNGAEMSDSKGRLAFNGLVQIKHLAMITTWYKAKYFWYFGRRDEADRRFANGECAMLTSTSSLFPSLADSKIVEVGVSEFPYHDDVYGAPQNTLADGSSLWIASGLKPAETKGVAKFVNYILGPEVQIKLTLAGGFLPMTPVARAAASSQVLKSDLAALNIAYAQLKGKTSSPAIRPAQIEPVRTILEDEIEEVFANRKPAKEALDQAVERGNAVLTGKRR